MKHLNDNERKALEAVCYDCDNLDGWGFTRIWDMCEAVAKAFDNNYQRAGGYIKVLKEKRLIDIHASEDEAWVSPEVFGEFC